MCIARHVCMHMKCMHSLFVQQDSLFFKVGILIGCSLVNGGSGYPFFTSPMYQYIVGTPLQNVTASADHVPSLDAKDFLTKVYQP